LTSIVERCNNALIEHKKLDKTTIKEETVENI